MNDYQPSFFDEAERFGALNRLNDPLVALNKHINFEMFRAQLAEVFAKEKASPSGRKAYDVVLMFKMLILQRLYNLSDQQLEYQVTDRLSFCRFLGLRMGSDVPDFTTVWRFREALTKANVIKALFKTFTKQLETQGVITKAGTIVDASFVEVPRQRNTREENELIKNGEVPPQWQDQPRKLCQKDTDARWTRKGSERYYGYKNHVCADAESEMIVDYAVTDAAVHDSQVMDAVLGGEREGMKLFADSAYKSKARDEQLDRQGVVNYIHEKHIPDGPLHDAWMTLLRLKSRIRCRVEHIFAFMENSMNGPELEYIGKARIETGIGLCNIAYNLMRYLQLMRLGRAKPVAQCA